METINKKKIEEFIRVDHAGERGAVKIYEGQLLALNTLVKDCLLYTSPSPRDGLLSRMPSSA